MPTLQAVCDLLTKLAPLELAEDWDNVGLLVGDRAAEVATVMTCLTITPAVVDEAIHQGVDLIVVHHPLPFKPMAKWTTDRIDSAMVLRLAAAGVAVYSAHTAYDSCSGGINAQWAAALGLNHVKPLVPGSVQPDVGSGRIGRLPSPLTAEAVLNRAAEICRSSAPRMTRLAGGLDVEEAIGGGGVVAASRQDAATGRTVVTVAIACGSGGSFVDAAARAGADLLLTGEATLHQCLAAQAAGLTLAMVGHHASEHWAMGAIGEAISRQSAGVRVLASRNDVDPVRQLKP